MLSARRSLDEEGAAPSAPVYVGLAMVYIADVASRLNAQAVRFSYHLRERATALSLSRLSKAGRC